jgi:hypothetical protein
MEGTEMTEMAAVVMIEIVAAVMANIVEAVKIEMVVVVMTMTAADDRDGGSNDNDGSR